jgi:hypothetical protein
VRPARSVQIQGQTFVQREASHDIEWSFDSEPIEIPNTGYYRQRIAYGELIAADQDTASVCGILPDQFVEPKALLPKLKEAAIKQFDAENGDGAYEYLAAERASSLAAAAGPETAPVVAPSDVSKPVPAAKQTLADAKGSAQ